MKITSWNVAGLRALIRKKGWDWVEKHNPDVLCLQEIKANPEQIAEGDQTIIRALQNLLEPGRKKRIQRYFTLVKDLPVMMKKGLGVDRFDHEGRTIQAEFEDFMLFNLYVPNGGRDHSRVPFKLDFYGALLDLCNSMHAAGKKIIICGDINTAHQEIDVNNPKSKSKITGFLPEERVWITKFLEHGFVDVFRVLYPERVQYTYWSYIGNQRGKNNGWRLDYFLVSEALLPKVKEVVTHPEVPGSDHGPVTLILSDTP